MYVAWMCVCTLTCCCFYFLEMHNRFLSMIENLPDTLRNQLRADTSDLTDPTAATLISFRHHEGSGGGGASVVSPSVGEVWADAVDSLRSQQQEMVGGAAEAATWGSTDPSKQHGPAKSQDTSARRYLSEIDQFDTRRRHSHASRQSTTTISITQDDEMISSSASTSRQRHHMRNGDARATSLNTSNRGRGIPGGGGGNWTSFGLSSLSSTPIDQLIAAILDGDVQGIRSVVRSRGDSLHSEFWAEISHSILPLHRAISGLHFHGNHKTLVHTLETLVQLGADVSAHDNSGNSVLHKVMR